MGVRVRVIASRVPGIGKHGDEKEIDGRSARVLELLGKVSRVEKAERKLEPPRAKRVYRRKDMVSEPLPVGEPTEVLQDPAEPAPDLQERQDQIDG